jgi:NitT/TauT family transport system ATP-binding protein
LWGGVADAKCVGRTLQPIVSIQAQVLPVSSPLPVPGASQARTPALEFIGVSISFKEAGKASFTAVENVDLTVLDGEFVALAGPTGSGKSTLLNAAAGLLKQSAGTCRIFGSEVNGIDRCVGYLFQSDALMPWKTALENVAIGLEVRGMKTAEARAEAQGWLARVGLQQFAGRYPHKLSGGQRKRVALAQALILKPRILLMDEPFGQLDAQTRVIMSELLPDLWSADKKAVLFVTHDLDEAIALADRVVILGAGPASSIVAGNPVTLARPRDPMAIRQTPEFSELHSKIWHQLKGEVLRSYEHQDRAEV